MPLPQKNQRNLKKSERCMIMNGQRKRYDFQAYCRQVKKMPGPVPAGELPKVKLDLRGVRKYAREKGVLISELTEEEKKQFIK